MNFDLVTFCQVWSEFWSRHRQTDRQRESDAYEPTVHMHYCHIILSETGCPLSMLRTIPLVNLMGGHCESTLDLHCDQEIFNCCGKCFPDNDLEMGDKTI